LIKQNHTLGIALSIAGYTAWVVGDTLVKLAGKTLPVVEILAINYLVSCLSTIVLAASRGGVQQLSTNRPGFHAWRAIFVMGATWGSFAGLMYLSLADFYTVIFTSPLILTALGSLILKEKVDLPMWLAIVFGFLGVVVAVQFSNFSGVSLSWVGVVVTSVASLSLAVAMLTARAAGNENNYALSFWPSAINFLVSAIAMLVLGKVTMNAEGTIYAALSGVLGALGLLLTNASLRVAPVAIVSPYHYIQIVGGIVIGYLIWHHVPTVAMLIGATMIIGSGVYVLRAEQKRAASEAAEAGVIPKQLISVRLEDA
jgi:drug/metabolite transporter (DMT)-like permease